jgi:hypothetical protein
VAGKRAERWSAPGTVYPHGQAERCRGRDPHFSEGQPQKLMSAFDPFQTFDSVSLQNFTSKWPWKAQYSIAPPRELRLRPKSEVPVNLA